MVCWVADRPALYANIFHGRCVTCNNYMLKCFLASCKHIENIGRPSSPLATVMMLSISTLSPTRASPGSQNWICSFEGLASIFNLLAPPSRKFGDSSEQKIVKFWMDEPGEAEMLGEYSEEMPIANPALHFFDRVQSPFGRPSDADRLALFLLLTSSEHIIWIPFIELAPILTLREVMNRLSGHVALLPHSSLGW